MPITLNPPFLSIANVRGRTMIVGDIHGCYDELVALLGCVSFGSDDVLVSVGDLVDRGPKSREVLQFFRDTRNAFSTVGNHDRRLAGSVRRTSQPAWSQLQTLEGIDQAEHAPWATFLESLPAVIQTPHAIITHARLDPDRPLDQQDPYFTCAVGGASVTIEQDEHDVPVWFRTRTWDRPVCMGHLSYARIELVPGSLYALDTKAAAGICLTAVIFPEARVFQVPSARDYYAEAWSAWQRAHRTAPQPGAWRFADAVKLLAVSAGEGESPDLIEARQHFETMKQGWAPFVDQIVETLHARFGPVPNPGPLRGDYFRAVKAAINDPLSASVATTIATWQALDLGALTSRVGRATVAEVDRAIRTLVQGLGGSP